MGQSSIGGKVLGIIGKRLRKSLAGLPFIAGASGLLVLLCCCVPIVYSPEPESTVNTPSTPERHDYYLSAPESDFHLRLANLLMKQFPRIRIQDSSLFLHAVIEEKHGRFIDVWQRYHAAQPGAVLPIDYLLHVDHYFGYNADCDNYVLAYPCSQEAGVSVRIVDMATGNLTKEVTLTDDSGEVIIGPLIMGVILLPDKKQALLETAAYQVGTTLTQLRPEGSIRIVLF
ncbi:hypothetical protein KUV89_01085 [Marinobacter hydrocarbonoclasticus]|nr:hypothetical protein [Marinobacter nauticus]